MKYSLVKLFLQDCFSQNIGLIPNMYVVYVIDAGVGWDVMRDQDNMASRATLKKTTIHVIVSKQKW